MRLLLVVVMIMMIDVFYHYEVMTSAKLGDSKLMSMVLPGKTKREPMAKDHGGALVDYPIYKWLITCNYG